MRISAWSSDVCSSDLSLNSLDASSSISLQLPLMQYIDPPQTYSFTSVGGVFGIGHLNVRSVTLHGPFGSSSRQVRSEEHTSELQSLMRISYAVFCLKKKNKNHTTKD